LFNEFTWNLYTPKESDFPAIIWINISRYFFDFVFNIAFYAKYPLLPLFFEMLKTKRENTLGIFLMGT